MIYKMNIFWGKNIPRSNREPKVLESLDGVAIRSGEEFKGSVQKYSDGEYIVLDLEGKKKIPIDLMRAIFNSGIGTAEFKLIERNREPGSDPKTDLLAKGTYSPHPSIKSIDTYLELHSESSHGNIITSCGDIHLLSLNYNSSEQGFLQGHEANWKVPFNLQNAQAIEKILEEELGIKPRSN